MLSMSGPFIFLGRTLHRPRQPSGFLAEHPPSPDLKISPPSKSQRSGWGTKGASNPSHRKAKLFCSKRGIYRQLYRLSVYHLCFSNHKPSEMGSMIRFRTLSSLQMIVSPWEELTRSEQSPWCISGMLMFKL